MFRWVLRVLTCVLAVLVSTQFMQMHAFSISTKEAIGDGDSPTAPGEGDARSISNGRAVQVGSVSPRGNVQEQLFQRCCHIQRPFLAMDLQDLVKLLVSAASTPGSPSASASASKSPDKLGGSSQEDTTFLVHVLDALEVAPTFQLSD
jgi:hypothetical protein